MAARPPQLYSEERVEHRSVRALELATLPPETGRVRELCYTAGAL